MKRIIVLLILSVSLVFSVSSQAYPHRKIVGWVDGCEIPGPAPDLGWGCFAGSDQSWLIEGVAIADDGSLWSLTYSTPGPWLHHGAMASLEGVWSIYSMVTVPGHRHIDRLYYLNNNTHLTLQGPGNMGTFRALMSDGTLWVLIHKSPACDYFGPSCDPNAQPPFTSSEPLCACTTESAAIDANFAWVPAAPPLP